MNPDTDSEWERWGQREPYFGVITDPKFRRAALTDEARKEFFDSGQAHVDYVLQMIRSYIDADFAPRRVLDFGCGVGRALVPFARITESVLGLDVSTSMLDEARANCSKSGAQNVRLALSEDDLSEVDSTFDLVHSFIVFQHIEPTRGKRIFGRLITKIAPGGIGALHFLYSKSRFDETLGVAPESPVGVSAPSATRSEEPEMQMNAYGATEVMFMLQRLGVHRVHFEFSDHGGELGLFAFFKVPG